MLRLILGAALLCSCFLPQQLSVAEARGKIMNSYFGKSPPEITSSAAQRLNTASDLSLEKLQGKLVLLLFTSTG